ncbi:MAG: serine/threonine protein kinase [Myxococcaceae bacterium]|nr:serine/threonine protein kinase [Myxococcaceae bacterium]
MALEAGTRVGRYTISRLLAQGGMAEVYRAEQELTKGITRPVAVKVIRPEYSESQDFREMFLDEARTACTLSHPNIAQIYDVGESDDGLLYMAMELVPGETLATINRTLREHQERFSDEALFAIGIWTASALEAVHALKTEGGSAGLVHRDVSPHNLLLSATGGLKLIDFGIAKAATNRNLTMPGVTKGKAGYFSPEQAMGKRLDGRSDLFSLGVTLYKLASGGTPFDEHKNHGERHAALVRGQWKDLDEVFPGLPPPFYEVVRRSLMLKPEERFQSAREMREALEKAAFDSGFRVGQSALLGYVDDDGEITASGGTRSSAFPAVITAPPSDVMLRPVVATPGFTGASATGLLPAQKKKKDHDTERVPAAKPAATPRRAFLVVAFVSAIVIGIFGTLLIAQGSKEPSIDIETPSVVVSDPPAADTPPAPVVKQPVDAPPKPPPVAVETPDVDLTTPPATKPTVAKKPPAKPKDVVAKVDPPKPPVEVVKAPPPPPVEDDVPDGIGTIRISVAGDTGAKVVVRGAAKSYEQDQPFNEKVPSGRYTVTVRLANGNLSSAWRGVVRPDQQKKLSYDVAQGRWNEL